MLKERLFTIIAFLIVLALIIINIFIDIYQVWFICATVLVLGMVADKFIKRK